jgi:hypothetical protein
MKVTPEMNSVPARIVATTVRSGRTLQPSDDPFAVAAESFCWPRAVTGRITTQGGLFSVHPHPDQDWLAPLSRAQHVFDIPGEMRGFFQRRLFYLGIDGQRIMGGIDGLGSRLAWQYSAKVGMRML